MAVSSLSLLGMSNTRTSAGGEHGICSFAIRGSLLVIHGPRRGDADVARRNRRGPQQRDGFAQSLATAVTKWAGSSWGFGSAVAVIAVWAITGPLFHFSDTW